MRISLLPLVVAVAAIGLLGTGCAKPEQKLGRGFRNVTELTRMGELRREFEQTALWDGPNKAYTGGLIRGFNKSLVRTGIGVYEIVTFPIPPYDPVLTHYVNAEPVYPDSYTPSILATGAVEPDAFLGFPGGDIAPMIPGSRFRIHDF